HADYHIHLGLPRSSAMGDSSDGCCHKASFLPYSCGCCTLLPVVRLDIPPCSTHTQQQIVYLAPDPRRGLHPFHADSTQRRRINWSNCTNRYKRVAETPILMGYLRSPKLSTNRTVSMVRRRSAVQVRLRAPIQTDGPWPPACWRPFFRVAPAR